LPAPAAPRRLARLDAFRGLFTGRRSLTSVQAAAAFGKSTYTSEKIRTALDFEFTPVEKVVKDVAAHYPTDWSINNDR